jgi:hypothetical protein
MPRGPQGQRRPANVIGNAVKVMRTANGQEPEDYGLDNEGNDPAAVELRGSSSPARTVPPLIAINYWITQWL